MRSRNFVILTLFSVCLALVLPLMLLVHDVHAQEAFYIEKYSIDIKTGTDSSYYFEEEITVFFTSKRHGIIRSIPKAGNDLPYFVSEISVSGDESTVEYDSYNINLRIGDANKEISGLKTYVIKYKLQFFKDTYDDFDFSYLNLIGTQWDTYIKNVDINYYYPVINDIPIKPYEYNLYAGRYGSESTGSALAESFANHIRITISEPLKNYEGISLLAKYDEMTFVDAPEQKLPYEISDYRAVISVSKDKRVSVEETFGLVINDHSTPVYHFIPLTDGYDSYLNIGRVKLNDANAVTSDDIRSRLVPLKEDGNYKVEYTIYYPLLSPSDRDTLRLTLFDFYRSTPLNGYEFSVISPARPKAVYAEFSDFRGRTTPESIPVGSDTKMSFATDEILPSYHGIYLDLSYPIDTFTFVLRFEYALLIVVPLLILLIVYLIFRKHGRDTRVSPVVEFYPPDNLSPAGVGYVINRIVDPADITSMLLYWASHGHLIFTATGKKDFEISPGTAIDDSHPVWEQLAFSELTILLQAHGNVMSRKSLQDTFYKVAQKIKASVPTYFSNERKLDTKLSSKYSLLSVSLGFIWTLISTAMVTYTGTHDFFSSLIAGLFSGASTILIYTLIYYLEAGWHKRKKITNIIVSFL
ncbi:MAG: DUF2207 domain-containing protein, partial [Eubacteriales bacterium]|nr:DUF2207 domain-containing protein [Eubacteriales bacterium]